MSPPITWEITLQASIDSHASVLHLKQARPSSYRQASECTLGRQDWESCSAVAHLLVKVNAYSCAVARIRKLRSGGWEPHWRGWEQAWWQSSGAKLVSRWISQWWKMKCTQPSETNRQAERWAQSCQCESFTHTHSHKPINTLTLPMCCLSLCRPHHHPHALN